ncbi:MAG: Obg family GTPase CgtA [Actinomycetota bacterium]|nr:Obg family GTPase CgtA [Actinomycetota bacterium]
MALNDLTNIEALQYVQHSLERLGVNKALRRAGVKEGDIVTIGDLEFEFQEDGNFDF